MTLSHMELLTMIFYMDIPNNGFLRFGCKIRPILKVDTHFDDLYIESK